jgi:hypothetical protein
MAAPHVCDGTSAVGESRHRIPRRIRWSTDLTLLSQTAPARGAGQMLPVLDLDPAIEAATAGCFETKPSSPIRQAWRNRSGPISPCISADRWPDHVRL